MLASASPARLSTLRAAGLDPEVLVSGVDESGLDALTPDELAATLASAKGEAVLAEVGTGREVVVVACDSVLEMHGTVHGKPGTDEAVRERWRRMRNEAGTLVTGHHVIVVRQGGVQRSTRTERTRVWFADVSDAEIEAYIATGEPQQVAGAFTIDGYGAAFVSRLEGDPHNVVGISLPLLRLMLADLGVSWPSLWRGGDTLSAP